MKRKFESIKNTDESNSELYSNNKIQLGGIVSRVNENDHVDEDDENHTNSSSLQLHETSITSSTMLTRIKCPYLDTINRQILDFDSEKLCSVTLTNMNVYVCLVCGKYFQGRGKSTPLFTHSVQLGHFVCMNLHSGRTYCLPDNYEIIDSSLQDIQKCVSPTFELQAISLVNTNTSLARDIHGISYLPGFVGLNNLNATDYISVLLHALAHVTPFRDFWLQNANYELCKSNVVHQFGLTMRKMWSANNFKSTVSPQELVQEIIVESNKRFTIGQRTECIDLLVWLLGALHKGLGTKAVASCAAASVVFVGNSSNSNTSAILNNITARIATTTTSGSKSVNAAPPSDVSVVYEPFQGIIEVTSLTKKLVNSYEDSRKDMSSASGGDNCSSEWVSSVQIITFNYLSVEIPPCPLFRDSEGGLIIPQIPLFEILKKFDGTTWTDQVSSEAHIRRKYRILQLPRYLILHLVRFTRNNFYLEKNPTIVTFPVKNLEMRQYVFTTDEPTATTDDKTNIDKKGSDIKKKRLHRQCTTADNQHWCKMMIDMCPNLSELPNMSCDRLVKLIQQIGSSLHKIQLQSILATVVTLNNKNSSNNSSNVGNVVVVLGEEFKPVVLPIAESAVERIQIFHATKYDLLANICHDSTSSSKMVTVGDLNMLLGQSTANVNKHQQQNKNNIKTINKKSSSTNTTVEGISTAAVSSNNRVLNDGVYKVHIQHKATGQWFEMQDLRVIEVTPQFIGVSESNILIYEKKYNHSNSSTHNSSLKHIV